jgi:hypothetical protein
LTALASSKIINRRLMRFSLAVVRAAPDRYAAWIVGASARMFGHSVMTNLPAMVALLVVAILWLVGGGLVTVLAHAPANRFIDTASLLVAAPLIYWVVLLVGPRVAVAAVSAAR